LLHLFTCNICGYQFSATIFAKMRVSSVIFSFAAAVAAHGDHGHDQEPLTGPLEKLWYNTLPGDGGTQVCIQQLQTRA
jgi:hypothetical protein